MAGTPEGRGNMNDRPRPRRVRRIAPLRTEPRAPALPEHSGPDRRSRTPLDGSTALALALARQQRCRELLAGRPAASAGEPLNGWVEGGPGAPVGAREIGADWGDPW